MSLSLNLDSVAASLGESVWSFYISGEALSAPPPSNASNPDLRFADITGRVTQAIVQFQRSSMGVSRSQSDEAPTSVLSECAATDVGLVCGAISFIEP